ncbi:hypothetical protein OPV22_013413 [Ensete ventricosum]|uniref:Uncharacterized protein n=1 Tax=Ensete ventricosum TaxID=4639 RepID=A0AAV8QVH6_ENSVE|nr:hypothetical protein OPV22_013413 [Ensete ventricosum]
MHVLAEPSVIPRERKHRETAITSLPSRRLSHELGRTIGVTYGSKEPRRLEPERAETISPRSERNMFGVCEKFPAIFLRHMGGPACVPAVQPNTGGGAAPLDHRPRDLSVIQWMATGTYSSLVLSPVVLRALTDRTNVS